MRDTWKISPSSYRFRSSAAMKPIYLLILLLFQTTFTTPDCPSWLDQTQVSTWCPHAVDQQNPIIFGFLKQFSLPFFHRLFFLLYAPGMPPVPSAPQSTDISVFLFSRSFWALPNVHWAKSDCSISPWAVKGCMISSIPPQADKIELNCIIMYFSAKRWPEQFLQFPPHTVQRAGQYFFFFFPAA